MENKHTWTWDKFYGFPFEIYSGAKEFWEPDDDYDDPDFWSNYPEQEPDLILAVRMYDYLMKTDPDNE